MVLSGTHRNLHSAGGHLAYAQYVRFLYRKSHELVPVEKYAQGYMDHLQQPLQPLMDNLEGETYEGFEKDPIKYRQYEEAVFRALMDRPQDFVTCVWRRFLRALCAQYDLEAETLARRELTLGDAPLQHDLRSRRRTRSARRWVSARGRASSAKNLAHGCRKEPECIRDVRI